MYRYKKGEEREGRFGDKKTGGTKGTQKKRTETRSKCNTESVFVVQTEDPHHVIFHLTVHRERSKHPPQRIDNTR